MQPKERRNQKRFGHRTVTRDRIEMVDKKAAVSSRNPTISRELSSEKKAITKTKLPAHSGRKRTDETAGRKRNHTATTKPQTKDLQKKKRKECSSEGYPMSQLTNKKQEQQIAIEPIYVYLKKKKELTAEMTKQNVKCSLRSWCELGTV